MNRLTWIASYPKSGSTWLRIFLANLLNPELAPVDINQLPLAEFSSVDRALMDKYFGLSSGLLTPAEITSLRRPAYQALMTSASAPRFAKIHDAWHDSPAIGAPFAGPHIAGAIYVVRNPLDVACSAAAQFGINIDAAIRRLCQVKSPLPEVSGPLGLQLPTVRATWSDHVTSWLNQADIPLHCVRYEDMLDEPQRAFAGVCRFLNIQVSDTDLTQAIQHSRFARLQKQEESAGFIEKSPRLPRFFRHGSSGRWREQLTPEQVERIRTAHHEVMSSLGYD